MNTITPEALERALSAARAALSLGDQAEIPTRTTTRWSPAGLRCKQCNRPHRTPRS
ncbi:hypothetical protein OCJ37_19780 [Xanthomonas sp. AM6]|uniref:hypothetical protein n=1 Tax=Xanthomonas sp. AM6 TaxID=2982531 RepID=UPI0021DA87BA|nr:hypothetical protein [Xanthomonas sp. AM6]UYB52174.1 hypothetical protein OCJ37_19780 [Xanthomonas sp. AM6]